MISEQEPLTDELLRQLYVDEGLSQNQIAMLYGRDQSAISRRLKRMKVAIRPNGESQKSIESFYRKRYRRKFWSKVKRGAANECWEWMGYKKTGFVSHGIYKAYGSINFDGVAKLAHRVAWEITNNRPVPEEMRVLHRCDNPSCVNPAHLFLGTMRDNAIDRSQKQRNNRPPGYLKNRTRGAV